MYHFSVYCLFSGETPTADTHSKQVRVLCWVMTSQDNLNEKAVHVKNTWGKRCDILLFASDTEDKEFGTMPINPGEGRKKLPTKTRQSLDYIYKHHIEDADWFIKCDDDTYVIMENLRYFLSGQNSSKPHYFGQHFLNDAGFNSGGAGYVLSREALQRFSGGNATARGVCDPRHQAGEDVLVSQCLRTLGVHIGDTRDALNRSRFHCLPPEFHITGNYNTWYKHYEKYKAKHVSIYLHRALCCLFRPDTDGTRVSKCGQLSQQTQDSTLCCFNVGPAPLAVGQY